MTESGVNALPASGTELTRFNALGHGVLSRYTVLPWEDADEYGAVVASLVAEHLVEELTGVLCRKRRLRLAEAAAHRRSLASTFSPRQDTAKAALAHLTEAHESLDVSEAVRITPAEVEDEMRALEDDEAMTRRALYILGSRRNDAYETALAELREDALSWWADTLALKPDELEDEEAGHPRHRWFAPLPGEQGAALVRRPEERNRQPPFGREQAFGESLDPDKLERLGRYEVHLDRELERMLSMLLRLKDLREGPAPD
jgi:hypothetical protein